MAKIKLSDKEQVDEHIAKIDPAISSTIEYIRQVILTIDVQIAERIKWNNPSMYYNGEMKPFDPKEYKREIVVFNLHKGRIMLVFPSGAKVDDDSGLLEGKFTDGRKIATFKDLADVKAKEKDLQNVIKKWLSLVE